MAIRKQLTAVPFTHVKINDQFWLPRIEINRTNTIPAEYKMCEDTGRVASFDLKWKPGDSNPPHIFWDSDVAKWIEAASYSLATHPDAQLDALIDQVVEKIASAQQPDGYLNTHYTQVEPDARWSNLRDCHELYCAGHLIEAAVAHYHATGKRKLLDVLCRYADYIDSVFGTQEGKKRGYPGHEELELALVKLYHATKNQRYLDLARYFIDERGRQPYYFDQEARLRGEDPAAYWAHTYAYMQAQVPVREQTEVTGHAVRAMYLYSAMADLANETGDETLLNTCDRLWEDLCLKRMYLTGGIGPSRSNEGFTTHYDLPDITAYAETCAAVGLVFWNHRMLQFEGNGKYADVMERALYNGAISGVSLDGRLFFYENPLASAGKHHRKGWFDCACCPPNIARMIASVGEYIYSQGENSAYVHLYVQGAATLDFAGKLVTLQQTTNYPWGGNVNVKIAVDQPTGFMLHLRVPEWCESYTVSLNSQDITERITARNGYFTIERNWNNGDTVELVFDMPVRFVVAHPNVQQMTGRVALMRGPIVYCLEGVDHNQISLDDIVIRTDSAAQTLFTPEYRPDLLGGVVILRGTGATAVRRNWEKTLYQTIQPDKAVSITAIPYYAWDNRGPGEMRVWLRTV